MDRVLASAPTRAEMAREIHAAYEAELLQDDELTHMIYAEFNRVSVRVAEKILLGEVAAGRYTRREAVGNRGMVWAYARCTESDGERPIGCTDGNTTGDYDALDRTDDIPY